MSARDGGTFSRDGTAIDLPGARLVGGDAEALEEARLLEEQNGTHDHGDCPACDASAALLERSNRTLRQQRDEAEAARLRTVDRMVEVGNAHANLEVRARMLEDVMKQVVEYIKPPKDLNGYMPPDWGWVSEVLSSALNPDAEKVDGQQ